VSLRRVNTTMRSLGIVILPPVGYDLVSMRQTGEPVQIEAFIAKFPIETLHAAVSVVEQ
jgi:hypothetical protein